MNPVAVINANSTCRPYRVAPLGLAFIASSLEQHGYTVKTFDCPFSPQDWQHWQRELLRFNPAFVAIGIRNLDNSDFVAYQSYLETPRKMVQIIHDILPNVKIILGGAAVTVDPQKILNEVGGDHLVIGEGEEAIVQLLNALDHEKSVDAIYTDCGSPFRVKQLDTLALPKLHQWFDLNDYLKADAGYPIQTKRGCPLKCSYCTYAKIEGRQYRKMAAQKVADEIEQAMSKGIDTFEFVDSTFNLPPSHALAVTQACLERGLKANYVGTGINPARFDIELAQSMAQLGFKTVIVTAESASQNMLDSYQKGFSLSNLHHTLATLNQVGIQSMWVFLLGGHLETKSTVEETLTFIDQFIKAPNVAYLTSGIRIYPGAPMEKDWRAERFNEADVRISPDGTPFFMSSQFPSAWLRERLLQFQETHPHVMLSDESHDWLVQRATDLLRWLGAPKPYWKYIPTLGRFRNLSRWPKRTWTKSTHLLRRRSS